ncbi:MAG: toprim domain-containing protein [Brachymonas sp.]
MQTVEQFRQAMAEAGLTPPNAIHADGQLHRFATNGKRSDTAGWYCLHADGLPAGAFGDWRTGMTQTWCAKADNAMTQEEREAYRQRMKAIQAQREAEQAQRHESAQHRAGRMLGGSIPAWEHPYLTAKGVPGYGLRRKGDVLLVPLRDTSGKLRSLQTIEADGQKRFLTGGKVQGCYHSIGKPEGCIVVCEGFATGASIHMATGQAVACAMNAGNLQAVAQALHTKYPALRIVIAADDDHATAGNPGMTAARQAALSVGGDVAVPLFDTNRPAKSTDFNDLHQSQGLEAVQSVFAEIEVRHA